MFITNTAKYPSTFLELSTFRNMIFIRSLILSALFLVSYSAYAQDTIPYFIDDVEYNIYQGMDKEEKSEFLSAVDAIEFEISEFMDVDYPIRITRKNGKQNLMLYGEVEFVYKKDLDEIAFFTETSSLAGITFGKFKGQEKIVFGNTYIQKENRKKDAWDKIIWKNKEWFIQEMKDAKGYRFSEAYPIAEFYVQEDGLWGVIGITESEIKIIVPPIYENKNDINQAIWTLNFVPNFQEIRKKLKVDLIEPLENMDEFYKVRSKKDKKWGVFHDIGGSKLTLDTSYDSIIGNDDQRIIILWKDNQVGLSDDEGHIYYTPAYDNYEIINLDYMYGIAFQSDNKWTLHSLEEPKKLVDQKAENTEQLIEYWLNRE